MRITRGLDDIQGKLSDNAQMATTLLDLPLELLLRIGNELNTEPDDDLTLYKQLRLVCRAFDRAFAPIVLSNIRIFGERVQDTHLLAHQFYVLTRGSHRLSYVKSVSLGSWNWLYELHDNLWLKCERTKGMVWEVVRLIRLLQRICEARRRYDLKRDIKRRGCVSFQLADVQRLSWFVKATECTQSLRLNCQILKTLPSLTELSLKLSMCPDPTTFDIGNEIGLAVAQHRHLRKLIIRMVIGFSREGSLDWLKRIIANNPDLTHLDLYQFGLHSPKLPSLSELLADVPAKHPLRLQHLRISTRFYQLTSDIVPHIRSLNSLHIWFPISGEPHSMDDAWDLLRGERIYVSEILTNRITLPLLDYLRDFNHLTTLSIYEDVDTPSELDVQDLFQILEQHTLQRLRINPYDWGMWFQHSTSITKFSHLQELVLCSRFRLEYDIVEDDSYFWASTYEDLERIAETVSQVETPVTIIMEGRFVLYYEFRLLCCASSSLSVRDLGRRMKYSKATFDMYDEWLVTIPESS